MVARGREQLEYGVMFVVTAGVRNVSFIVLRSDRQLCCAHACLHPI